MFALGQNPASQDETHGETYNERVRFLEGDRPGIMRIENESGLSVDYGTLYWIAYRVLCANGGEGLFGNGSVRLDVSGEEGRPDNAELALSAFLSCAVGDAMPTLYFEVPLSGEPRFDLQVCIDRTSLPEGARLPEGAPSHLQGAVDWLLKDGNGCTGVDFAFDLHTGDVPSPQVIAFTDGCETCDLESFFECAGDAGAASRYEAAQLRAPQGWHPWYTGLIPQRLGRPVRLDYFVADDKAAQYARDIGLLAADLRQMGYRASDLELARCADLLAHPFRLNIQLDVLEDGSVGPVLGYNASFGGLSAPEARASATDGAISRIMRLVEGWGLADERWRLLAGRCIACKLPLPDGRVVMVHSAPTFLKVRMTPEGLVDAKVYIMCTIRLHDPSSTA